VSSTAEFCSCFALTRLCFKDNLTLHGNQFEGAIPPSICKRKGDSAFSLHYLTVNCAQVSCPVVCCTCVE